MQFYTCGRFPTSIITRNSSSSVSSDNVNTKQYDDLVSYDSYLDGQEYEGEYMKEKFKSEWNYGDLRSDSDSSVSTNHNLAFISGKNGAHYTKYCAFTLQPQNYPNAINIVSLIQIIIIISHSLSNWIYKFLERFSLPGSTSRTSVLS